MARSQGDDLLKSIYPIFQYQPVRFPSHQASIVTRGTSTFGPRPGPITIDVNESHLPYFFEIPSTSCSASLDGISLAEMELCAIDSAEGQNIPLLHLCSLSLHAGLTTFSSNRSISNEAREVQGSVD